MLLVNGLAIRRQAHTQHSRKILKFLLSTYFEECGCILFPHSRILSMYVHPFPRLQVILSNNTNKTRVRHAWRFHRLQGLARVSVLCVLQCASSKARHDFQCENIFAWPCVASLVPLACTRVPLVGISYMDPILAVRMSNRGNPKLSGNEHAHEDHHCTLSNWCNQELTCFVNSSLGSRAGLRHLKRMGYWIF